MYSSVCTEGDAATGTKYYLAAPHDKPSLVAGTCTHKPEASMDFGKVSACKAQKTEADCGKLSHCSWNRPTQKIRTNVDCGTLVATAPNPKAITDAIGGPASAAATLEACNALCLQDYAAQGCTQFLWDGDSSDASSKGKCLPMKYGCTYDASGSYGAYLASGYEEPSREPEVCTHKSAMNKDVAVVALCKTLDKATCTDSANTSKCQWTSLCTLKLAKALGTASTCSGP